MFNLKPCQNFSHPKIELDLLLIIADGKLKVTWDNTLLLVIASGIASELEDFSRKIFEDGSEVNYGSK